MHISKRLLWIGGLISSLVLGGVSVPASADIAVVVAADNAMNSLSADQVKLIFLGKRKKFPDGHPAEPINQPEESRIYSQFANLILGKDPAQLKAYWSVQVFSGMGSPPKQADGDKAVKSMVAASDKAIGYIDSSHVDDSVKVVLTVGK